MTQASEVDPSVVRRQDAERRDMREAVDRNRNQAT